MTGNLSYFKDITERKRAETALEERERALAALTSELETALREWRRTFDAMRDAVALFDAEGRVVRANAAAAAFTGLDFAAMEGRACYEVFHGTSDYHANCPQLRAIESGQPESGLLEQDGKWLRVTFDPEFDADGRVCGGVHVVSDVTELVQLEERLVESEERLAGALEGSDIGLWDWHVQTGDVVFNERWAEIVGHTLEEISPVSVGTWEHFAHPEDLERSNELLARHFAGESPIYECEARMRHKDGHWVWVLDRGRVREWDDDGSPLRMIGTHLDITARKTAEAELAPVGRRARGPDSSAHRAARDGQPGARGLRLLGLARPARPPPRNRRLQCRGDGGRPGQAGRSEIGHLQRVRDAAQRMASLIDDLLALSRATQADLAREQVDVSALAQTIVEELREAEPARTVDVVVTPGIEADADPVLLRAILFNLLGNAWKFTGRHARARVEVGCAEDGEGERVYFVRDDGAGFDPGKARHVFRAFQRCHTPDQFEGSGIGLATVQRLVAKHGGRVWAEAELEKGATFFFTLHGDDRVRPAPAGDRH